MKRIILFLGLLVASVPGQNALTGGTALTGGIKLGASAGGSSCAVLITQASQNDFINVSNGISQKIRNSDLGGKAICQIDLFLQWNTVDASLHLELWSTPTGAGTQYGGNSGNYTTTAAANTSFAFSTFTWGSPVTNPGADFYIRLVQNDANDSRWGLNLTDNYAGTSYSAFQGASDETPWDFAFKLYGQ